MKKMNKVIMLLMSGVIAVGLVGCGGTKPKETSPTNNTNTTVQEQKENKLEPKVALKNTIVEGEYTDEEKSKIVELTDKASKAGLQLDYNTDTLETYKEFHKYVTEGISAKETDEVLSKSLEGDKSLKKIYKLEGIEFNSIKRNNDVIIVDFTVKQHVVSHNDATKNGKTFDVKCKFAFNKEFKISAYSFGELE